MQNKAFTLIELLVVILIIGILAAIAVPQYKKAVVKAKFSTLKALTRSLYEAEKAYFLQNGTWATDFTKLDLSVAGRLAFGSYTNSVIYFDNNKACSISGDYIYCHDYDGIGMAYLIMFEDSKHYCVASDDFTVEICKTETGSQSPYVGRWYQYQ